MGYTEGDTVVHPHHGPAVVGALFTRDLGQGLTKYLELHIEAAAMKILVPAAEVERVGIRSLASREDAEAILSLLGERSDVPKDWAERNPATLSRMKSHELEQMAMVVRDLLRHQRRIGKPLNMGEKSALDNCLGRLARELALTLGMSEDATKALLIEQGSDEHAVAGDVA